jgi:PAX-interacting protein 1
MTNNTRNTLQQLFKLCKNFSAKYVKKQIHLQTECEDSFRTIQKYLRENNIPARMMDLTLSKPKKFVIRGLPVWTDIDELTEELKTHDIDPIKIAFLKNRRNKQPMPLFLLTANNSPALDNLHKIKTLNHLLVTFENYRSTGVAQCYRCQEFGHSSLTCNLTQKCLKCSGPHRAGDCTADKKEFKCANCGENHTANFKGCRLHPDNRMKTKNKTNYSQGRKFIPAPIPTTTIWRFKGPPNEKKVLTKLTEEEVNQQLPTTSVQKQSNGKTIKSPTKQNSPTNENVNELTESNKLNSSSKQNQSTKKVSKNSTQENSDSSASFFEIIKTVKELMKEFNVAEIMSLLKKIASIMKNKEEDPIQKLLLAFEAIADYFESVGGHG